MDQIKYYSRLWIVSINKYNDGFISVQSVLLCTCQTMYGVPLHYTIVRSEVGGWGKEGPGIFVFSGELLL